MYIHVYNHKQNLKLENVNLNPNCMHEIKYIHYHSSNDARFRVSMSKHITRLNNMSYDGQRELWSM